MQLSSIRGIDTLKSIHQAIVNRSEQIRVDSLFSPTKGSPERSQLILCRDLDLEYSVKSRIERGISYSILMERYRAYDPKISDRGWPDHVPMRVLAGYGPLASGHNVFLFFPEALGLEEQELDQAREFPTFGIELVDVMERAFLECVFPCVQKLFDLDSQLQIMSLLHSRVARTDYLASVFHEVGHRVGPFRVSPDKDPAVQISGFEFDAIGELSSDSLLVTNLWEFPDVLLWSTLQRIFWYARIGSGQSPTQSQLGTDNDSWTGAFLWNRLEISGALSKVTDDQWSFDVTNALDTWKDIRDDVHEIADRVSSGGSAREQLRLARDWMSSELEPRSEGGFALPESLQHAYQLIQGVPERPQYAPPVNLPLREVLTHGPGLVQADPPARTSDRPDDARDDIPYADGEAGVPEMIRPEWMIV